MVQILVGVLVRCALLPEAQVEVAPHLRVLAVTVDPVEPVGSALESFLEIRGGRSDGLTNRACVAQAETRAVPGAGARRARECRLNLLPSGGPVAEARCQNDRWRACPHAHEMDLATIGESHRVRRISIGGQRLVG